MKQIFSLSIIIICISASCNTEISKSDISNGIIHGKVADITTGLGIPNSTISLRGYEITGSIITTGPSFLVATTTSDVNGNFSFDFNFNEENGYFCTGIADQYFDYQEEFSIDNTTSDDSQNVEILLQPIGYVAIHFLNDSPFNETDKIALNGLGVVSFIGSNIDTSIVFAANGNSENFLYWVVTKNSITNTFGDTLYCTPFDTTNYDLLY